MLSKYSALFPKVQKFTNQVHFRSYLTGRTHVFLTRLVSQKRVSGILTLYSVACRRLTVFDPYVNKTSQQFLICDPGIRWSSPTA